MTIPREVQSMIAELRTQHAELAGVSDEQILMMLPHAQSKAASGSSIQDLDKMLAVECGALGEQLLFTGRWDDAEQCLFAALEKGELEGELKIQCMAVMALGRLCEHRDNRH